MRCRYYVAVLSWFLCNQAYVVSQGVAGRRVDPFAIGSEHGLESIRRCKNNFDKRALGGINSLRSQRVFHLVRQRAQFLVSTGRRVPLEGMHYAANAPNDFRVARARLKLQSRLIKLLQQFLRTLKKQLAQLRRTFLGEEVHAGTSIR